MLEGKQITRQTVGLIPTLCCRTALLVLLITALDGVWSLEQPSGSLLEFHPAWREVVNSIFRCGGDYAAFCLDLWFCMLVTQKHRSSNMNLCGYPKNPSKVQKVSWWMAHYKSKTPKRHIAFGNTRMLLALDKGRLRKWKHTRGPKVQTAVHYLDKHGKKRYKGTPQLKETENLAWILNLVGGVRAS